MTLDPDDLAAAQLARDRARSRRFPWLGSRKLDRMARSPLAYLRGAAPLFYEALIREPWLAEGPRGEGTLVGDLHLENFGAYRLEDDTITFDLNDFDEAAHGPLRLDLLRLVTSLVLGGRTMGFDGRRALMLGRGMLETYSEVAMEGAPLPAPPETVRSLAMRVGARTKRELLDARTTLSKGMRRFVRGERYVDLPRALAVKAADAFARYASTISNKSERGGLDPLDLAFRIAGTGGLGAFRVAVLTRGKGAAEGAWIFDMKEETEPVAATLLGPEANGGLRPAARVLSAMLDCLGRSPKQAGVATMGRTSLLVRRLSPQEDKLDLRRIPATDFEPLARHLGGLIGRAHARGASSPSKRAWSSRDIDGLLERATLLAGLHEAAYLSMCRRLDDKPPRN